MDNITPEIGRLANQFKNGELSAEEFEDAKRKLLGLPSIDRIPTTGAGNHGAQNPRSDDSAQSPTDGGNSARPKRWLLIGAFGLFAVLVAAGMMLFVPVQPPPASPTSASNPPQEIAESERESVQKVQNVSEPAPSSPKASGSSRHPELIAAPNINVGDRVTSETTTTDHEGKVTTSESVREVTSIDDERIIVAVTNAKSNKQRTLIYDRNWNLIETGNSPSEGFRYEPPIRYFDFPLKAGKKWTSVSLETDKKTGKTRQHTISGEVIGWDTQVSASLGEPYGTAETVKVILNTSVSDQDGTVTGTDVSWYAPLLGRSIKSELVGLTSAGKSESKSIMMTKFSGSVDLKYLEEQVDNEKVKATAGETRELVGKGAENKDSKHASDIVADLIEKLGLDGLAVTQEKFAALYGKPCNAYGERTVCSNITSGPACLSASMGAISSCEIALLYRNGKFQCISVSTSPQGRHAQPSLQDVARVLKKVNRIFGDPVISQKDIFSISYEYARWSNSGMEIILTSHKGYDFQGNPTSGLDFGICDPENNKLPP